MSYDIYKMFLLVDNIRKIYVCLFSWLYNPLWLYFYSPVPGFSFIVFEVS